MLYTKPEFSNDMFKNPPAEMRGVPFGPLLGLNQLKLRNFLCSKKESGTKIKTLPKFYYIAKSDNFLTPKAEKLLTIKLVCAIICSTIRNVPNFGEG